uniref:Uncharacterized protein n=1 Tax=Anopheles culicifacies TaxID=139723 RepID=A0A182LSE4_9DIPT
MPPWRWRIVGEQKHKKPTYIVTLRKQVAEYQQQFQHPSTSGSQQPGSSLTSKPPSVELLCPASSSSTTSKPAGRNLSDSHTSIISYRAPSTLIARYLYKYLCSKTVHARSVPPGPFYEKQCYADKRGPPKNLLTTDPRFLQTTWKHIRWFALIFKHSTRCGATSPAVGWPNQFIALRPLQQKASSWCITCHNQSDKDAREESITGWLVG